MTGSFDGSTTCMTHRRGCRDDHRLLRAHGIRLDELIEALAIEVGPVSVREGEVSRHAYRRFGRGSESAARLNYGDCFAYALSVVSGEPLLFVGEDFTHTDIAAALRGRRPHAAPRRAPAAVGGLNRPPLRVF